MPNQPVPPIRSTPNLDRCGLWMENFPETPRDINFVCLIIASLADEVAALRVEMRTSAVTLEKIIQSSLYPDFELEA
jgi:hypothetical protein